MRENRILLPALAALMLGLSVPSSRADATNRDLFELYRWGEYDSLIRMLGPRLDAGPTAGFPQAADKADSLSLAQANLCLGVAFWATGDTSAGTRAFARAAGLDRDLVLDPLYSTGKMRDRYESIRAEAGRRQSAAPGTQGPVSRAETAPRLGEKPKRGWLLWTGAMLATGAAAGAYYLANVPSRRGEEVYVIDVVDAVDPLPEIP